MSELKHKIYSSTECLSEKMMFDYIDNKLSPKERHLAEKHMLDCGLCSDALEGLELVKNRSKILNIKNAIDSRNISKKEATIISINYKIIFSIAAAIALLVTGVFFFNHLTNKSMESSDMAELKTDAAPSPPAAVSLSDEVTGAAEKTAQSEKELLSKSKEALLESPKFISEEEEHTKYKKNGSPEENREQTISGEGAANGAYELDQIVTQADDRLVTAMPVQTESNNKPQEGAAEREKNTPADTKKTEDQKPTENAFYTWSTNNKTKTSDITLEEKQAQKNNNADIDGNTGLAKNTDKSGKYRSETKRKDKDISKAPEKEARADEDIAVTGTVAYEPQSVSEAKEELKPQVTTKVDSISPDFAYNIAEVMPEYPGGADSLMKFITKNFKYQSFKQENESIQTKIYVQFIVGKNGSIRDAKIIKGINPQLDKEALRVVSMMPQWKAGRQNGKPVSVIYNLPIQLEIK